MREMCRVFIKQLMGVTLFCGPLVGTVLQHF